MNAHELPNFKHYVLGDGPSTIHYVPLGWDTWSQVCELCGIPAAEHVVLGENGEIGMIIPTKRRLWAAAPGNLICKLVKTGELFVCTDLLELSAAEAYHRQKDRDK